MLQAVGMAVPADALSLFARQLGVAARRQLVELDWPEGAIDGWVRYGRLEVLHRGVYRALGSAGSWEQQLMAAVLAAGPGARADGAASCALHGIEGFSRRGPIGVIVPIPRRIRSASFPVASRILEPVDCMMLGPIPGLRAPRGIIEIAPRMAEKRVRVAIDSGRRLGLLSIDLLARRAVGLGSHRGAQRIRKIVGTGAFEQESEGERMLKGFLRPLGLDLDWRVGDLVPGRRLDAVEWDLMLAFEYDGRDRHVLPTDRDNDGLRDLECLERGLQVIRVTYGMIRDAPEETLRRIAAVFRRRAAELGAIVA